MNRSALLIITSNPLASPMPAEAIRIAAGLVPWKKFEIQIYLHHPFVKALDLHSHDIQDLNVIRQFLPDLCRQDNLVYGPDQNTRTVDFEGEILQWNPLNEMDLALMAAHSNWLLHF